MATIFVSLLFLYFGRATCNHFNEKLFVGAVWSDEGGKSNAKIAPKNDKKPDADHLTDEVFEQEIGNDKSEPNKSVSRTGLLFVADVQNAKCIHQLSF